MLAAALTVIAVILGTSAAFGWNIWLIWLRALPAHTQLYNLDVARHDLLSPTVTANLQMLGAPEWLISSVQVTAAICGAVIVWWSFRRLSREAAVLALCAATFLATPHALLYDLPMLGGAIVLYRAKHPQTVDALTVGKKIMLLAGLWLPFLLGSKLCLPLSTVILSGVIWVAGQEAAARIGVGSNIGIDAQFREMRRSLASRRKAGVGGV
jgi:hypothetical protein